MARIAHIAVKVEDIGRTSKLYRDVFGFAHTGTHITPAGAANEHTHTTQHLCDGSIDLALVYYSEDHGEPNALPAEGIDHIGIADSDLAAAAERIKSNGGEVIGAPGVEPMKFRMPGGIIAEVISEGRFTVDHLAKTASKGRQRMLDAGALFVAVVVASNLVGVLKDYRQRLLNVRLMLALRRALFDRLAQHVEGFVKVHPLIDP